MAAPALVALAHGSRDPRSARTVTALVDEVKAQRPDLRVERAFLEKSRPEFQKVVDRLVRAGFEEIVVVPLLLSDPPPTRRARRGRRGHRRATPSCGSG